MKTIIARFSMLLLAALAFTTSIHPAAAAGFHYDFEAGSLSPWVGGADPGVPNHSLSVAGGDSFGGGTHYAAMTANAPFMPQSGVWMFSRYGSRPGLTETVTVRFAVKNKTTCTTCRAIAWIGDGPVSASNQFTTLGPIASTTWTVYTFSKTVTPVSGAIGVALGWFGAPGGFPATVGFDLIDVTITP